MKYVSSRNTSIDKDAMINAVFRTNEFLISLPATFSMDSVEFYQTLGQRNLSGFVGEVFSIMISAEAQNLAKNPHPDGRPDLIDLREKSAQLHFISECLDENGKPIRAMLAPFKYGGIEVKATIGNHSQGGATGIGIPRVANIRSLNFWAHHRHKCNLLGIYYDFLASRAGAPQILALFNAQIEEDDWAAVSVGKVGSKKTSNTSLNAAGREKITKGLMCYYDDGPYRELLLRLGVTERA